MVAVGALFPAVGHTIGKLNVPKSVSNLLGGADYGTITGWFRSEIAAIYGPLVIGALAITGASATTAGEEEDRILGLVLAHPIRRSRLVAAKAAAIAGVVLIIAFATWIGTDRRRGRRRRRDHPRPTSPHSPCSSRSSGSPPEPSRSPSAPAPAADRSPPEPPQPWRILGWLINSFAPLVSAIDWLKYLSLFYYYAGHDPLTQGVDITGVIVLGVVSLVLTALGMVGIERRDLRA